MIRIAVVEDNKVAAETLKICLERFSEEYQVEMGVTVFEKAIPFLEAGSASFDLVFMDIELPDISGLQACYRIREQDEKIVIIFVTNMAQYAVKGYEVDALDFMVKPVNYYGIKMKMKKALKQILARQDSFVCLNYSGGMKRVSVNDILYVEIISHRLLYHTYGETIELSGTLSGVENDLKGHSFSRCNSCYLVNLSKVSGIDYDNVLVGRESLKISRSKRKVFLQDLAQFYGGMNR